MTSTPNQVTDEMLTAAMKKAVAEGIFPKHTDTESYLKNWTRMKAVLQTAINSDNDEPQTQTEACERAT